jgi:glycosyltransferase involved in cell wall biosynthesis
VRVAALWDAEVEVAKRIDEGDYDLCLVNSCWLTHSPLLLTRLRTPSLYFAQEPRRISSEAQLRQRAFSSGPVARRGYLRAADAILRRTDARAAKAADQLACNSAFSAESILRTYGRNARIVRLGVDAERFRATESVRDDFVLSVGALEPVKGHETLIQAIGLLPLGQRPALKIVYGRAFAGMEATLNELAQKRGVSLDLISGVSDTQLVQLYSTARLTASAARLEPFGLTPLESLSCGTPVLAINEGGFRETVLDGLNGLLVPPTPEDIAAGLRRLLEGTLGVDRQLLRDTVASWTWERTVEELHEVYADMVSTTALGRRTPASTSDDSA